MRSASYTDDERAIARPVVAERDQPAVVLARRVRARHEQRLARSRCVSGSTCCTSAPVFASSLPIAAELVEHEIRQRVLGAFAAGRHRRELAGARERDLAAQRLCVEIDHRAVRLALAERRDRRPGRELPIS